MSAQAVEETLGEGIVSKGPTTEHVPGDYVATVLEVKNEGPNKYNPAKDQFRFKFQLDNGEETSLWVNKSFGFSEANGYSKLAQLVQSLTGIPCGDRRQKDITLSSLVGLRLNVITKLSKTGYANIDAFAPHIEE
jgi:hypothetical protein